MANEKLPDLSQLTGLNILTVMHDDWCLLPLEQGRCTCNPEFGGIVQVTDDNAEAVANQISKDNERTAQLRRASRN